MKFLFTGNFDPDYNRNSIIIKGLRSLGHHVVLHTFSKNSNENASKIRQISSDFDFVHLPSFSHKSISFVRKNTNKPIIFDPLISRYMTKIFDYQTVWRFSPNALRLLLQEKIQLSKAEIILNDTKSHRDYFVKTFNSSPSKHFVVPIGVDSTLFKPIEKKSRPDVFLVGYIGGFIPLHGTEIILEAASIIQSQRKYDIQFEMVGTGFEYEKILKKARFSGLRNVNFPGWLPFYELNERISNYDLCLGIFGDKIKTDVVIPNKAYEYMAAGKCMITKNTPAINEYFTDGMDLSLVRYSPSELAEKIIYFYNNPQSALEIGKNAMIHIQSKFTEKHVAQILIEALES